jgi:hypothetical protein
LLAFHSRASIRTKEGKGQKGKARSGKDDGHVFSAQRFVQHEEFFPEGEKGVRYYE